jgi:hypothetical protein
MPFASKIIYKINTLKAQVHIYIYILPTLQKKLSVFIANTDLLMVYGISFAVYFEKHTKPLYTVYSKRHSS